MDQCPITLTSSLKLCQSEETTQSAPGSICHVEFWLVGKEDVTLTYKASTVNGGPVEFVRKFHSQRFSVWHWSSSVGRAWRRLGLKTFVEAGDFRPEVPPPGSDRHG